VLCVAGWLTGWLDGWLRGSKHPHVHSERVRHRFNALTPFLTRAATVLCALSLFYAIS